MPAQRWPCVHGPGYRPRSDVFRRAAAACALALLAAAAHAQPAASILEGLAPLAEIAPLETPPMAAALFAVTVGADEPERFADPFEVDVSPATHGRWETTPDGRTAVWRLPVVSTGAVSLNFGFTRYRMPEGGRLRVLTLDGAEIVGPYTDADNKTHGELWTPLVSGGEAVIEVTVPASRVGELELDLGSVNRGFRDILGVASRAVDTSCQIDAVCPAADPYRDQVRSVALIVLRGIKQCSGALLNNTARDGTPYFLTAGHCGDLEDDLSIARGIVLYWNYQATECGAREFGGETQDQTGTVVRAHHEHTDFVLLELDAKPPAAANVYFAGWSWAAEAPSSSFSIHQGVPSPKAISIDNDPAEIKPYLAVLDWDAFEPDPNELYLGVEQFEQGSVEPGSSGGALFDQDKRVVGQLRGAQTGCTSRGPAMSGRLAKSWSIGSEWDGSLRHWLDPLGTGETAIDGRNGNHPPTASGTLDDKSLRPSDNGQAGRLTAELSYGFLDPDRDDLTYAVSSSDASKVTAAVNGSSVALEAVAAGSATITVTATDAGNLSAMQTFTATVDDNRSPEASQAIARLTLDVDDGARSVDISDVFADADSDALTYGASSSDASVATVELVQLGAQTTVTVTPQSNGSARVLVTATDAAGSNTSATRSFEVVVNNRAPVLILPTLTMRSRERRKLRFSDIVSDPDGDLLRYGVTEIHDGPLTRAAGRRRREPVDPGSRSSHVHGHGDRRAGVEHPNEPRRDRDSRERYAQAR